MSIITRGLGPETALVTQGFAYTITIVNPDDGTTYEYMNGGIGYAKKFDYKYLKDLIDDVIQTEKIRTKKEKLKLFVEVKLKGVDPLVYADLESLQFKDHIIKIKVTN